MLDVSASGYYAWRSRPPSPRALRHAWLTEHIRVHLPFGGTYGSRRVHAELRLGRGVAVGYHAVEVLMRPCRHPGPARQSPALAEAPDTYRQRPSQPRLRPIVAEPLWVPDITEHPTREGKIHCAVVLDTFSRRVVGWSIDAPQTATLVTNALGMAISNRQPAGALIQSDHGVQFTS